MNKTIKFVVLYFSILLAAPICIATMITFCENGQEQKETSATQDTTHACPPDTVSGADNVSHRMFQLQSGDKFLACSDGLYRPIAPDALLAGMMAPRPLRQILDGFGLQCEENGDDNYTGILLEVE